MHKLKGEKIMNTVTSLVAIVSLALAAAGGAAKEQAADSQAARPITTLKLGVNHNETLVSDAAR